MSATHATAADAYKAVGDLDLANLPAPLTITIDHDSENYARWKVAVHVQASKFDQWFIQIGADSFSVRQREDEYLEMSAVSAGGVTLFCLVKKDEMRGASA